MSGNRQFGIACKTCRRRGRKCDRVLPRCMSCRSRGVECEGYALRWVTVHGAGRGTLGAASAQDASLNPVLEPPSRGWNHRPAGGSGEAALEEADEHAKESSTSHTPNPEYQVVPMKRRQDWRILMTRGTIRDDLGRFIEYYTQGLSTAFYIGYGPAETYDTCRILPMARNIASVRCAVAATAACHLANRLENVEMKRRSLHLRLKATELLREGLNSGPDGSHLTCMLLLAQLDVCSGDCIEFETHLQAASKFINVRGSASVERGFVEQRIAWLYIMGATTSPRKPYLTPEDVKTALNKFRTPSGTREWGFDVFYCPVDIFDYIADVTFLYKSLPDYRQVDQENMQKAVIIGQAIRRWDASTVSGPRRHMVEVWRLGALLYLVRLFRLPDDLFNTDHISRSLFIHASAIPSRTSWSYSTSWPLFQAGLLLSNEDAQTKIWLRNELYTNFRTLGCLHPRLAAQTLERVWVSGTDWLYEAPNSNFTPRNLIL